MATHDYVIDNSTGANVRADLNLVLQAILSNNSSSSAPSTTAAYMWWADTTNGVLKIRNSANNAWVELLQLDGTLTLEDGSQSSPALGFRDDLDTGVFSGGANEINIVAGGVRRADFGNAIVFNEDGADVDTRIEGDTDANAFVVDASTNYVGVGIATPAQKFQVYGNSGVTSIAVGDNSTTQPYMLLEANETDNVCTVHSRTNNALTFKIATSEKVRIDSSGNFLLGLSAARANFGNNTSGVTFRSQIEGTTGIAAGFTVVRNSNDANDGTILIGKTRGTSVGSNTVVQAGDDLGTFAFHGSDGTSLLEGAHIKAVVETGVGNDDMPASLVFSTNSGTTSSSEEMRLTSAGILLLGKTSTSQTYTLQVQADSQANAIAIYGRTADDIAEIGYYENDGTTKLGELQYRQDYVAFRHRVGHIEFHTTYSGNSMAERMRLFQDQLCIGMTAGSGLGSSRRLQVRGTTHSNNGINILSTHNDDNPAVIDIGKSRSSGNAILGNNDDVGQINFYGNDGSGFHSMARILCSCVGNDTSSDDLPSQLRFYTLTDNNTALQERLRLDHNGVTTITQGNSSQASDALIIVRPNASTGLQNDMVQFECGNQGRGKIVSSSSDGSSPQFAASSDYRLKENIRDYTQGYENIKAIPVKIFDMISDGTKDVVGWIAHEVQPHIPEAVIGDKDAVVTQAMVDSGEIEASELGNDIIQTLSYGAFMPDVVGALQTAIAKIEVLETKVAALEAA